MLCQIGGHGLIAMQDVAVEVLKEEEGSNLIRKTEELLVDLGDKLEDVIIMIQDVTTLVIRNKNLKIFVINIWKHLPRMFISHF